jgi:hypothetical protein
MCLVWSLSMTVTSSGVTEGYEVLTSGITLVLSLVEERMASLTWVILPCLSFLKQARTPGAHAPPQPSYALWRPVNAPQTPCTTPPGYPPKSPWWRSSDQSRKTCLKKIDSVDWPKESSLAESPKSVLTPECAIIHEHDHVQKLLVTGAPTG